MPDYGQDSPTPGMGTFATQARFNTQAPMPPARNTLQDLIEYLKTMAPAAPQLKSLMGNMMPQPRGQGLEDLMLP